MGKENDIIVDEELSESQASDTGTVVHLEQLKKKGSINKKLQSIARVLVEKLLPYFTVTTTHVQKSPSQKETAQTRSDSTILIGNELSKFIRDPNRKQRVRAGRNQWQRGVCRSTLQVLFAKPQGEQDSSGRPQTRSVWLPDPPIHPRVLARILREGRRRRRRL